MFVRCRHAAGEAEIPAAAVEAMTAIGWEPISGPRTYGQAEDEATVAAQRQAQPAAPAAEPPTEQEPPPAAPTTSDRRRRAATDREQ